MQQHGIELLREEKWSRQYHEHRILPKSGGKPQVREPHTPEEDRLIIEMRKAGKLWREVTD